MAAGLLVAGVWGLANLAGRAAESPATPDDAPQLLAGSLLSLANPWMAGLLTASVMDDGERGMGARGLLGLWLGLMLLRSLLSFATQFYIGSTGERITAELRTRLYQHLQALPVDYYQQRRSGDTLTLLSTDAAIISNFVTNTLVQLLPALVTFGGACVMMAWLDWSIAVLAVVFLPAYFIAMKVVGRRLRPLSRAWVDANSHLVSVVEENLGMLPAITASTRAAHEQGRFEEANQRLFSLSQQQWRIEAALSPLISLLGGVGVVVLLWLGTSRIESGQLAPADPRSARRSIDSALEPSGWMLRRPQSWRQEHSSSSLMRRGVNPSTWLGEAESSWKRRRTRFRQAMKTANPMSR